MSLVVTGAVITASIGFTQAAVNEKDPRAAALGYVSDATQADAKKYPNHVAGQLCGNCALNRASRAKRPAIARGSPVDRSPSRAGAALGPRKADVRPEKTSPSRPAGADFKGNKLSLPSKPCVACKRAMTWRKRWSRSWDEVKFCSDACRRNRTPQKGATG